MGVVCMGHAVREAPSFWRVLGPRTRLFGRCSATTNGCLRSLEGTRRRMFGLGASCAARRKGASAIEVLYPCSCGLDVHSIMACALWEETTRNNRRDVQGVHCGTKIPELKLALEGRATGHHRFLLKEMLDDLRHVKSKMSILEKEIEQRLRPFGMRSLGFARFLVWTE